LIRNVGDRACAMSHVAAEACSAHSGWLQGVVTGICLQRGTGSGSSSSGRHPNFAVLNRRRHLCSAGRPWRWALAHIL